MSYCQGMAFVAGVILMYLPEEPAFSVLTRLMGPGGPDLRTLFLPGASPLSLPGLSLLRLTLCCYRRLHAWFQGRLQPCHAVMLPESLTGHLRMKACWWKIREAVVACCRSGGPEAASAQL